MMATEVKVPTLGESITEATLGQWLKQPGEAVKADEPIASLETDKVAVDVPSPVDGVMGEQLVKEGYSMAYGARFLKRVIEAKVKLPISQRWAEGTAFAAVVEGGEVTIQVSEGTYPALAATA